MSISVSGSTYGNNCGKYGSRVNANTAGDSMQAERMFNAQTSTFITPTGHDIYGRPTGQYATYLNAFGAPGASYNNIHGDVLRDTLLRQVSFQTSSLSDHTYDTIAGANRAQSATNRFSNVACGTPVTNETLSYTNTPRQ